MTKTISVLCAALLGLLCAGCGSSGSPRAASTPKVTSAAACSAQTLSCGGSSTPSPTARADAASTSLYQAVTEIPAAEFNAVGNGGGVTPTGPIIAAPTPIATSAMTENGKPRILYVGAEWCPYCAAQRWVLAIALSRFGTFSNLGQTSSAADDIYPSTPTLTFYKSTFTSPYLVFAPYEVEDNQKNNLMTLSASDNKLFTNPNLGASGFPFVDIAGRYKSAVMYDPGLLRSDPAQQYSAPLTYAQIEAALKDPNSKLGRAIIGAANIFTAYVCKVTGNQPVNVCDSPGVRSAA